MKRINACIGGDDDTYKRAVSCGMMLSCDNAHALHPAHPEKYDANNNVLMNEGVVIKSHAGQKYTSDALSVAIFKDICKKADVSVQYFSNRSDVNGGSTLGNISTSHVSINCVDIGLAQLSMHSAYETAGADDMQYLINACKQFYSSKFTRCKDKIKIED